MLPGYNHNIEYQGRTFHVQTEDSGINNPHIITHLFEGGNILESRKFDYSNILDSEQRDKVLMSLMLNQHQALIRELEEGELDAVISGSASPSTEIPVEPTPSESPEPTQTPETPRDPAAQEIPSQAAPSETEFEPAWLAGLEPPRIIHRNTAPAPPAARSEAELAAMALSTITDIVEGGRLQLPSSSSGQGSLDDAMNVILSDLDKSSDAN